MLLHIAQGEVQRPVSRPQGEACEATLPPGGLETTLCKALGPPEAVDSV